MSDKREPGSINNDQLNNNNKDQKSPFEPSGRSRKDLHSKSPHSSRAKLWERDLKASSKKAPVEFQEVQIFNAEKMKENQKKENNRPSFFNKEDIHSQDKLTSRNPSKSTKDSHPSMNENDTFAKNNQDNEAKKQLSHRSHDSHQITKKIQLNDLNKVKQTKQVAAGQESHQNLDETIIIPTKNKANATKPSMADTHNVSKNENYYVRAKNPSHNPEELASVATLPEENNLPKRRQKKKEDPYALNELDPKKKTIFSINVFLNVVGRLLLILILFGILLGSLAVGTGMGYFANLVSKTPPPSQEQMLEDINRLEQQSTIYYANGSPIANVQSDLVRSLTQLEEISPLIVDGIIATEDEYFYEHPGVVPKAILRAALQTLLQGSGTGGSTITQQLVKQQMLSNDVTFFRKANEILLALRLENNFTKDDILTAYLNVSPFGRNNKGENVAGIAKASEGIFGVKANEVNLNQAAFLVGLPQDPYIYTPYDQTGEIRSQEALEAGITRMKNVLYRMYRSQKITKEEYDQALTYDITKDFIATEKRKENRQSYLYQAMAHGAIEKLMHINILDDGYTLEQVYSDDEWYNEYYFAAEEQLRTGGYRIYTTIDKEIYDQLQVSAKAYEDQLGVSYEGVYINPDTGEETYYLEKVQTGMVVIDNKSGKLLGFVSGTDYENNQIDHAFKMRRSPGSTIKPLAVYGPAVEHNIINPSSIIPDTPFVFTYEDGTTWEPTNYGSAVSNTFMTARKALLRSDNLPAVRIYQEMQKQGVPVIEYLAKMGFNTVDSYTKEDTENLAFALGGVTKGPTVFEEARAFTTFANNGNYVDGYYIERIEDAFGNTVFQQSAEPVKVFSEDSNYLMVDMLRDTMTEGTGRTANQYKEVPGDWIAKTGISENSKDIWVLASTPAITIGSWIGYDSRYAEYTIDVNDGFGLESVRSQIYWSSIVNDLYRIRPEIFGTDLSFKQPASVVETNIVSTTGTLPGTTEFNGRRFSVTQPLAKELFKVSNPAPVLTYNFLIGATDEELMMFWSGAYNQLLQQENQNYQNNDSQESESSEANESSSEGESGNPEESPGDGTNPTDPNQSGENAGNESQP